MYTQLYILISYCFQQFLLRLSSPSLSIFQPFLQPLCVLHLPLLKHTFYYWVWGHLSYDTESHMQMWRYHSDSFKSQTWSGLAPSSAVTLGSAPLSSKICRTCMYISYQKYTVLLDICMSTLTQYPCIFYMYACAWVFPCVNTIEILLFISNALC